jgi:hypothetical protein
MPAHPVTIKRNVAVNHCHGNVLTRQTTRSAELSTTPSPVVLACHKRRQKDGYVFAAAGGGLSTKPSQERSHLSAGRRFLRRL